MVLIRSVVPLENFQVQLEFSTGEQKVVNLEPLLRGPIFEPIRQSSEMFRAVTVDPELGTITWPNGADMDPDVLYGSHYPAWMDAVEKAVA